MSHVFSASIRPWALRRFHVLTAVNPAAVSVGARLSLRQRFHPPWIPAPKWCCWLIRWLFYTFSEAPPCGFPRWLRQHRRFHAYSPLLWRAPALNFTRWSYPAQRPSQPCRPCQVHMAPPSHPGHGIAHQPLSPCGRDTRSGKHALQSYSKRWLDEHFARVSRERSVQKTLNFKPASLGSEAFQRCTVPETETFVSKEQNCIQGHFLKKLGSEQFSVGSGCLWAECFLDGLCFALY